MICICLVIYIIIYYSHYATCHFHYHLCKPLDVRLKYLRNLPEIMTQRQFNQILHHMENQNNASACLASSFEHICPNKIKLGIIFAQRHGGSTWIENELGKYKQISIGGEQLLHWEHSECSPFAKTFEHKQCDKMSFINAMDIIYSNQIDDRMCRHQNKEYFFWNIQISQIPPYFFLTLIDYIFCHNIMILHIIRRAAVASFWSLQAQTVERMHTLDADKMRMAQSLDKEERATSLLLDPYLTAKYVQTIETNRQMFAQLIKESKCIKYQQYDYEDLIGEYAHRYWESILHWIGGPKLKQNKRTNNQNENKREHPMPCFTKISNWKSVKEALNGTDSCFACQKYNS